MRVLVTGAAGFIGRNMCVALTERGHTPVPFTRDQRPNALVELVACCDAVIHLAGANRPHDPSGFTADNATLAEILADGVRHDGRPIPLIFASSTQSTEANPYGESKRAAEIALEAAAATAQVVIFRLPNVFGKWARPFYNSAVATFCHQAAHGQPLSVNDPSSPLRLVYVDDVVSAFLRFVETPVPGLSHGRVEPEFETSVGEVASRIQAMAAGRQALAVSETGHGLGRALYATFLSHLPTNSFSYPLPVYGDDRGRFVEAVKTGASGQFSYFTQVPGVERGGHYHHSKSEKFLVVRGRARFRFRHLLTGERVDFEVDASQPRIVDTIPGWVHDVQNLGNDELIVLIWANEVFDRRNPDTIVGKVAL